MYSNNITIFFTISHRGLKSKEEIFATVSQVYLFLLLLVLNRTQEHT